MDLRHERVNQKTEWHAINSSVQICYPIRCENIDSKQTYLNKIECLKIEVCLCIRVKKMFVFRKIWRAFFSWNTRFEIRPSALLPSKLVTFQSTTLHSASSFWRVHKKITPCGYQGVRNVSFSETLVCGLNGWSSACHHFEKSIVFKSKVLVWSFR